MARKTNNSPQENSIKQEAVRKKLSIKESLQAWKNKVARDQSNRIETSHQDCIDWLCDIEINIKQKLSASFTFEDVEGLRDLRTYFKESETFALLENAISDFSIKVCADIRLLSPQHSDVGILLVDLIAVYISNIMGGKGKHQTNVDSNMHCSHKLMSILIDVTKKATAGKTLLMPLLDNVVAKNIHTLVRRKLIALVNMLLQECMENKVFLRQQAESVRYMAQLAQLLISASDFELQSLCTETIFRMIPGKKDKMEYLKKIFAGKQSVIDHFATLSAANFQMDSRLFINMINKGQLGNVKNSVISLECMNVVIPGKKLKPVDTINTIWIDINEHSITFLCNALNGNQWYEHLLEIQYHEISTWSISKSEKKIELVLNLRDEQSKAVITNTVLTFANNDAIVNTFHEIFKQHNVNKEKVSTPSFYAVKEERTDPVPSSVRHPITKLPAKFNLPTEEKVQNTTPPKRPLTTVSTMKATVQPENKASPVSAEKRRHVDEDRYVPPTSDSDHENEHPTSVVHSSRSRPTKRSARVACMSASRSRRQQEVEEKDSYEEQDQEEEEEEDNDDHDDNSYARAHDQERDNEDDDNEEEEEEKETERKTASYQKSELNQRKRVRPETGTKSSHDDRGAYHPSPAMVLKPFEHHVRDHLGQEDDIEGIMTVVKSKTLFVKKSVPNKIQSRIQQKTQMFSQILKETLDAVLVQGMDSISAHQQSVHDIIVKNDQGMNHLRDEQLNLLEKFQENMNYYEEVHGKYIRKLVKKQDALQSLIPDMEHAIADYNAAVERSMQESIGKARRQLEANDISLITPQRKGMQSRVANFLQTLEV